MNAEVKAKVVYSNTNRGFGFAQVEDANGHAQQVYFPISALAETPKETDTIYLTIRRNDLGPIGIGVEHEDDSQDINEYPFSAQSISVRSGTRGRAVAERVRCPSCATDTSAQLGDLPGASGTVTCPKCRSRYHIHRDSHGKPFSRAWGANAVAGIAVICSQCQCEVPVTFRQKDTLEQRFCMSCNSRLTIESSGRVLECSSGQPTQAQRATFAAGRWHLTCPKCETPVPSLWSSGNTYKAVCKPCNLLLSATCEDNTDDDHEEPSVESPENDTA